MKKTQTHRIVPGYEGGEYVEGNCVELSYTQHLMWHFAEWQRKGNWQDLRAWKLMANMPHEFRGTSGFRGQHHTEATLEKLRKKRRPESEATRQKKREAKLGTVPWNKGIKVPTANRWWVNKTGNTAYQPESPGPNFKRGRKW